MPCSHSLTRVLPGPIWLFGTMVFRSEVPQGSAQCGALQILTTQIRVSGCMLETD